MIEGDLQSYAFTSVSRNSVVPGAVPAHLDQASTWQLQPQITEAAPQALAREGDPVFHSANS